MNESWRKGFSFGLTSGIITTLGMIVGLHSSTGSQIVVMNIELWAGGKLIAKASKAIELVKG